jgi:penicillin-binding protein 2
VKKTRRDIEAATRTIGRRAMLIGGFQAVVAGALAVRLAHLQGAEAEHFRLLAEENRISIRLLAPARGLILDARGRVIAGNEPVYRIVIRREDAGDVQAVLNRLSSLVPLSPEEIERAMRDMSRRRAFVPVMVTDRIGWEDLSRVALNAPALPGVSPEVGLSRIYPLDQDFAHIVGYVGPVSERDMADQETPDPVLQLPRFQIGKIGVERWMERELRGSAGTMRVEVNAAGRVMRELDRRPGMAGEDVRLTIDASLQNYVQARLGEASASAVLMDVESGDLLACASAPSFDPNLFVRGISTIDYAALTENELRPLANKAVQGLYPPGSTYKMVTALAALEAGLIDAQTTVFCPGHIDASGRRFHCWKRGGHGRMDLRASLAESCDVYYYDIAQKVGIDAIAEMAARLGLGQRHDLPMSAISAGLNPNRAWKRGVRGQDWRIGDTINASIGQGYVLSSPLQLAVMTARLATGRAVTPRIIRAVGAAERVPAPPASLGIRPEHLRLVCEGMNAAVNARTGTAWSSRIQEPAVRLAGKTGTSQVRNITAAERARGVQSNDDLPREQRDHALFVGYAPIDAPRLAVSVVVEHGGGGSGVAAPIARDILMQALHGGFPPIAIYPESQRTRIEAERRKLNLRPGELPGGEGPGNGLGGTPGQPPAGNPITGAGRTRA